MNRYNVKWADGQSTVIIANNSQEAQEIAEKTRPNITIKSIEII